jgi:hypothetical protein
MCYIICAIHPGQRRYNVGNMKSKRVMKAEAKTRQAKKRIEHIAKRKSAGKAK